MYGFLLFLHILVSLLLIVVILLQSSKGCGLAGAFGGPGAMGTVFGGRGAATFLSKTTTVLAALFMGMALILGMMTRGRTTEKSLTQEALENAKLSAPARALPAIEEGMGTLGGENVTPFPAQGDTSK
jgi:preprotein translocase subunit SecG